MYIYIYRPPFSFLAEQTDKKLGALCDLSRFMRGRYERSLVARLFFSLLRINYIVLAECFSIRYRLFYSLVVDVCIVK